MDCHCSAQPETSSQHSPGTLYSAALSRPQPASTVRPLPAPLVCVGAQRTYSRHWSRANLSLHRRELPCCCMYAAPHAWQELATYHLWPSGLKKQHVYPVRRNSVKPLLLDHTMPERPRRPPDRHQQRNALFPKRSTPAPWPWLFLSSVNGNMWWGAPGSRFIKTWCRRSTRRRRRSWTSIPSTPRLSPCSPFLTATAARRVPRWGRRQARRVAADGKRKGCNKQWYSSSII